MQFRSPRRECGTIGAPLPLFIKPEVNIMTPLQNKRAFRTDLLIAGVFVVSGLVISGMSLAQIANQHQQLAQATQPLQSTPGAESKPSTPPDPTTTGARPHEIAPQPARPDAEAQQAGDKPALPPAPAEKTGDPIRTK
jgi:uncharacterized iron-regulated membrane protein